MTANFAPCGRLATGWAFRTDAWRPLLLLSGARRTEAGEAKWSEFDLEKQTWTIPPERSKSNATHRVPLSPEAMKLLKALPRHDGFIFSTTGGKRPVGDYSGAKAAINMAMAKELGAKPAPWQLHDLRRTVRTRLSELKIEERVAELVIGHARKGLQRTYGCRHGSANEMRAALCAWAEHLASIVNPAPPDKKVLAFGKRRKRA